LNRPKQSGFVRAGHQTKHRLIMATKAMQKAGKSYLGLTMPAPLAVIALEPGLDGVIERFQDHKEIFVADYVAEIEELRREVVDAAKALPAREKSTEDSVADHGHAANMRAARDILNRMKVDYLEALGEAKSVFMDTGTELWRLIRVANLGKVEQVKGRYYGNANQEMLSFVRSAYSSDANVLFSHRLKKEYANDKPTGNLEMAGFGEMEFEVQLVVQQWKEQEESIPDRFHSMITDCRLDPAKEGEEFQGETNTFAFIAASVFGNDPAEWE